MDGGADAAFAQRSSALLVHETQQLGAARVAEPAQARRGGPPQSLPPRLEGGEGAGWLDPGLEGRDGPRRVERGEGLADALGFVAAGELALMLDREPGDRVEGSRVTEASERAHGAGPYRSRRIVEP